MIFFFFYRAMGAAKGQNRVQKCDFWRCRGSKFHFFLLKPQNTSSYHVPSKFHDYAPNIDLKPPFLHHKMCIVLIQLFPANLGDSACISEIVQAISALRQFGGRSAVGYDSVAAMSKLVALLPNYVQIVKIGRKKVYLQQEYVHYFNINLNCKGAVES